VGKGACQMQVDRSNQKEIYAISEPDNYISFLVAPTSPFSRGTSHIQSASAEAAPTIDPQQLAHSLDLEILARHAVRTKDSRNQAVGRSVETR